MNFVLILNTFTMIESYVICYFTRFDFVFFLNSFSDFFIKTVSAYVSSA